jgi:hypothetical protein
LFANTQAWFASCGQVCHQTHEQYCTVVCVAFGGHGLVSCQWLPWHFATQESFLFPGFSVFDFHCLLFSQQIPDWSATLVLH